MDFQSTSAIVHTPSSGKSSTARIHKAISLDNDLAGLAKNYFGIDLTSIPTATDEDLAEYADRAIAAKELQEILPIVRKHFTQLIEAQINYEQFLSDVQKEVATAAKKIDKNVLDVWLNSQGYKDHIKLMGQKAHNGRLLQEAGTKSAVTINQLDFDIALQLVQRRQLSQTQRINQKIPQAERREQLNEQLLDSRQRRKDLLTYGSAGNPQKKGFWESVGDWFQGK